jgi:predicted permease
MGILSSPNTTSITLIIIEVLHPLLNSLTYNSAATLRGVEIEPLVIPDARDRGLMYISLTSIFSNIWRWTMPFNLINSRDEEVLSVSNEGVKEKLLPGEVQNNLEKNNLPANVVKKSSDKSIKEILLEIMNLPIIVSIITLLLCLNENVKNLFVTPDGILRETITNVHVTISRGYPFCVIFMLGLNFANIVENNNENKINSVENNNLVNDKKEKIDYNKIIILTFLKLIVIPLIGAPIIFFFHNQNIIHDPVLVFILLFMLSSPIAINVLVICSLKKAWLQFTSILMVVNYCASIITITFSNALFLFILSHYYK